MTWDTKRSRHIMKKHWCCIRVLQKATLYPQDFKSAIQHGNDSGTMHISLQPAVITWIKQPMPSPLTLAIPSGFICSLLPKDHNPKETVKPGEMDRLTIKRFIFAAGVLTLMASSCKNIAPGQAIPSG